MRAAFVALGALAILSAACGDDVDGGGGGGDAGGPVGGGSEGGGGESAGGGGAGGAEPSEPQVIFPRTGITPDQVGVLVNDADPLSVEIASYYVEARSIPESNVVHLSLPSSTADAMTQAEFGPLEAQVEAALEGTNVQALAITWTKPYRVDNMSVTSAFAYGYRPIGDTCGDPNSQGAAQNPYASAPESTSPFTDLGFRPAMTIPATTIEDARALIDRGVASDDTWPAGSTHLMNTSDQIRSARCILNPAYGWTNECQALLDVWDTTASGVSASIVDADSIVGEAAVLFYVQGLASVADIATNTYVPGAVADHLTSFGGQIPTSGQMSAIEFLRGGATGSYGTVVEPCAYQEKFPDPAVLVPAYFGGATLIEAYWKSVDWPAEGIFIGEPLARPWGTGFRSTFEDGTLTIETTAMAPGRIYLVEAGDSPDGPFEAVLENLSVERWRRSMFEIPDADRSVYRFREAR